MQVAVAGMEHVGDAQAVALFHRLHARKHAGRAACAGSCRPCSNSRARSGRPPGKAALRPAQNSSRSSSDWLARQLVAPCCARRCVSTAAIR